MILNSIAVARVDVLEGRHRLDFGGLLDLGISQVEEAHVENSVLSEPA